MQRLVAFYAKKWINKLNVVGGKCEQWYSTICSGTTVLVCTLVQTLSKCKAFAQKRTLPSKCICSLSLCLNCLLTFSRKGDFLVLAGDPISLKSRFWQSFLYGEIFGTKQWSCHTSSIICNVESKCFSFKEILS